MIDAKDVNNLAISMVGSGAAWVFDNFFQIAGLTLTALSFLFVARRYYLNRETELLQQEKLRIEIEQMRSGYNG